MCFTTFRGCSKAMRLGKSRAECLNSILPDKHLNRMVSNHDQICTEYGIWVNTGPKNSSPSGCANITGAFFCVSSNTSPPRKTQKNTKNQQPLKSQSTKKQHSQMALPNGPDGTFHSTTVPPLIGGRCCCCALLGGGLGAGRCTQHRTASAHSANH